MENCASPPSTTSTTTATLTPPREGVKITITNHHHHSISLMSSPSTCSSSIDDAVSSTQNRLNQARLILQYQELNDHYDLCRARLIDLHSEVESLCHKNAELRLANAELLKLLSSQASFHNLFFLSN